MFRIAEFSFFFVVMIFFSTCPLQAQGEEVSSSDDPKQIAGDHVRRLRQGILIVRLPSNHRKIEAYQELIDGGNLKEGEQQRLERQKAVTLEETREFNRLVMEAFAREYNFSAVQFTLDTSTAHLLSGNRHGFFLNDSLEIDPDIQREPGTGYILRIGSTDYANSTGIEAMIIADDELNDLKAPFPYYSRLHHFSAVMGSIFPAEKQREKDIRRTVRKLNRGLNSFYLKTGGGN